MQLERLIVKVDTDMGDVGQSFVRIQRDVQMAQSAFRQGSISLDDYKTALNFAQKEAIALKQAGIKPTGVELTAFNNVMTKTGANAGKMTQGLGTLRSAIGSVAAQSLGLSGRFGEVASMVAGLSVGALTTIGVFAGLAGIAALFAKITEESRKAKQRIDEFIKSSKTLKEMEAGAALGAAVSERDRIKGLLAAGGRNRTINAMGGPVEVFTPLSDKERADLTQKLFELNRAIEDTGEGFAALNRLGNGAVSGQVMLADAIERTKAELRGLEFQRGFVTQKDEADKLDEKIKDLTSRLAAMNAEAARFGGLAAIRARAAALDGSMIAGPGRGLLQGRGFQMPEPAKTSWRLVLDPQTGLSAWKRITEGGLPINVPAGLTPLTAAPTGTGAAAAGAFDSLKTGVGDIFSRIFDPKQIGSQILGNVLTSGLSSLLSTAGGLLSGLFSNAPDAQEVERMRVIQANTEALDRVKEGLLHLGIETAAQDFSGVGTALSTAIDTFAKISSAGAFGWPDKRTFDEVLNDELQKLGLSMEDLEAAAKSLGFEWDGTIEAAAAVAEALRSISTFARDFSLLQTRFSLFDVTDPSQKFTETMDLLAASVGPEFAKVLQGLTPENFDAWLKATFGAGFSAFDQSLLGNLPFDEFLQGLGFAESSLDGLADATNKATSAMRNVPAGFKVDLLRFRSSDAVTSGSSLPVTSTATPGSAGGGFTPAFAQALAAAGVGSGITVQGDLVVQANDPDEMRRKIEEQAQWARRTGTGGVTTLRTVRI